MKNALRCLLPLALFAAGDSICATHPADLDATVDEVVARYALPGIAVGVIEDGRIVKVVTRGEVEAGSGRPITSRTLFKIASNSKAMTASVLARLVDQGKLRWEDPVIEHLPSFRMHDPWVTQHMQVRDLLVHNSGLPEGGGDLMLWPEPNHFTRADILAGLAHIKPAYSFRSGYAYDNLLYVVAGEVAAAAGGAPFETLVEREVFQPLGLSRCRVGAWQRDEVDDVAQPHARSSGRNVVVRRDAPAVDALVSAAAGGIRCSLDDMLAWAMNWLAPSEAQQAWLSPEQRREAWVPRTPMPISARRRAWDGTRAYGYGYGWRIADVDGTYTVSHTGTLSGMYSAMSLVPDRRSGFVVLINGEADDARTVLNQVLLKRFTAPQRNPGVAYYADALAAEGPPSTQGDAIPEQERSVPSNSELRQWWGVYLDPWFGQVRICRDGDRTRVASEKSPRLVGSVARIGARYVVDWDHDHEEAWLDFSSAGDPAKARLAMAKVDPEADFSYDYEDLAFERVRGCE
jgi:CubicO group peptidase (beta-lactamase class C family)